LNNVTMLAKIAAIGRDTEIQENTETHQKIFINTHAHARAHMHMHTHTHLFYI